MCIDAHLKHIILLVVLAHSVFYSGCSVPHIVRQANGNFVSGLEGWEVAPVESVSVVGEEKRRSFSTSRAFSSPVDVRQTGSAFCYKSWNA